MHDVMEGLLAAFSWNSVLCSWHSPGWIKRGSGDAKTLLHGSQSELAQQFKVASDGARALNWERLAI